MNAKKTEMRLHHPREGHPVRIVSDAAVSTVGLHGGRMLPVLLLDTSDRPDIAELIRVHRSAPGDVKSQWGWIEGHEGTVALFLTFIRPMELFMVLEFNVAQQGILVELILSGQGLYIARAEDADDRFGKNIDRPKVIVEVGDTGFRKGWDDLFHKHLVKDFRNKGLGRSEAKRAARSAIDKLRNVSSMKMRDKR